MSHPKNTRVAPILGPGEHAKAPAVSLEAAPIVGNLRDCVIASDGRESFIGRVASELDGRMVLRPAYSYLASTERTSNGSVMRPRMVLPIELSAAIDRVELRPASVIRLDVLGSSEAFAFLDAIEKAERMRVEVRAKMSGLVIAGSNGVPR